MFGRNTNRPYQRGDATIRKQLTDELVLILSQISNGEIPPDKMSTEAQFLMSTVDFSNYDRVRANIPSYAEEIYAKHCEGKDESNG